MTPEENAYASNVKFAKFNQENKAKLPTLAAKLIGWNNGERLVTGKDPLTGEDANRWASDAGKLFNPPKLDKLSPKEIVDLNIQELKGRLPEGWTFHENNGRVHIKENGKMRVRIDLPDNVGTDYTHMHIYDKNGKPLDIHGNNVDVKSPAGHIPWDKW